MLWLFARRERRETRVMCGAAHGTPPTSGDGRMFGLCAPNALMCPACLMHATCALGNLQELSL